MCACSQDTTKPVGKVQYHQYRFDTTSLVIKQTSYSTSIPIQFLQLHSNETTAGEAAGFVSEEIGIDFLQIINNQKRLVEFETDKEQFRFDPNRMFSTEGIVASLHLHSQYSEKAFQLTYRFREFLLGLVDLRKTIVAVHNNTDGGFSILDYKKNGTGLVHQNNSHDLDDFFITTDSTYFEKIKERGFNVVLEYSDKLKDDGSLSIYCSRNRIPYINVEAEHGHRQEQLIMLQALFQILK